MQTLKIATFNAEWMYAIFGCQWKNWDGQIPVSFPGKKQGPISFEKIDDVHGLCRRIAGVINDINAQIVGIVEGPPLKEQMDLFVKDFLGDNYVVHSSNPNEQTNHILVKKSLAKKVSSIGYDTPEMKEEWTKMTFQPWGTIAKDEAKNHKFDRFPLVLNLSPKKKVLLQVVLVHTKSKISKLKTKTQWVNRDQAAVQDALEARQKLSAEALRIREYLNKQLSAEPDKAIVVMGDMNDGPYSELLEKEFLIHNIIDEMIGSVLYPESFMHHAMDPDVLATAYSTRFNDPLAGGQEVNELIDHVLVSPGIYYGKSPFKLVTGSCKVEHNAYNAHYEGNTRQQRPSDHVPVSFELEY